MLKWMKVVNLALVEEAEVEFAPGFNAITGETGAGKSVIMGAVSLLLGERADKSLIRTGESRCEICAEFTVPDFAQKEIRPILERTGLTDEAAGLFPDTLLIRRVITPSSSRNFINSIPVTLPVLQEIGKHMIDVHAANTSQSLMLPSEQLTVLDRFAGLGTLLSQAAEAWEALQKIRADQAEYLAGMPSPEETARMRRDAEEIERANPEPGEDEALRERHDLAASSRTIIEHAMRAEHALTEEEGSLFDNLADIRRILQELERTDSVHGAEFVAQADAISESISDLSASLESYAASVDIDEAEFAAMEERMHVLQTLKRRYGPALDQVLEHLEYLRGRINDFDNAEQKRMEFEKQEKAAYKVWQDIALEIRKHRKAAASKLLDMLSAETQKLGFLQAKFQIEFQSAPDGPNGFDSILMLFSANPGVPLKPLRDVASSGEISRVMLAVKTVLAEADAVPILIFDEIDANIGGETALTVGKELAQLGVKGKQVICISHQPQAARFAEAHFLVSKESHDGTTHSTVRMLDAKGRIAEIARMFGGGEASLKHARALLSRNE